MRKFPTQQELFRGVTKKRMYRCLTCGFVGEVFDFYGNNHFYRCPKCYTSFKDYKKFIMPVTVEAPKKIF